MARGQGQGQGFTQIISQSTGRRLTNTAADTDIVNFSTLCLTIQSGPLRFRSLWSPAQA